MKKFFKKVISLILALVLLVYAMSLFVVGIDTRNIVDNIDPVKIYEKIQTVRKFSKIEQTIANEYIDPVDEEKLLESAYNGMLGYLDDRYSYYFSKKALEEHLFRREGAFGGIGVSVKNDFDNLIIEVVDFIGESPAKDAGIMIGDHILSADGNTFSDKESMIELFDKIVGEVGTTVKVGVYRTQTDQDLTFDIERKKIIVSSVSREIIDETGYIKIESFTVGVSKDFKEALDWIVSQKAANLIIDVRGNGGGSLDEVIKVSDLLLSGDMIVYVEDRYGSKKEYFSNADSVKIPLAVLADAGSASASELFAGAIQANKRGVIVGETTFGKGIVQTEYYLSDGTGFKITTQKYYLPSGQSIHGKGITPDIQITQNEGAVPIKSDKAFDEAVKYLLDNE